MSSSRRLISGLFRLALVVLAIVFVSRYFKRRVSRSMPVSSHVRLQSDSPPADSLGPGDIRIFDADSAVDLTLVGDKILAGLSPKTVAQVKNEMDKSTGDTTGLGGSISQIVKRSVAGAIGTHAVFPISDIRDIRYEHDQIVFDWTDGGKHELFGNTQVNGSKASKSFRREDAERFIAAFRARKGLPPST
jgi:hypothetical protein